MATKKSSDKKQIFYLAVILLAFAAFLFFNKKASAPTDGSTKYGVSPAQQAIGTPALPPAYKINGVPFTSQAPYGVWDKIHNEACEKASVLMVYAWLKNIEISQSFAEQEIQKLSAWSFNRYNSWDLSAKQTAEMAAVNYGLTYRLVSKPTTEDIKRELSQNHIVIMGMAGMKLQNPYFRNPGPIYHMLVLVGYDRTGFIVNDPGTKHGQDFRYTYQNLMDAAHDWSGSAGTLLNSPAVAIIISKSNSK